MSKLILNRIMGLTGARYAYNLSGLPGPLQLLPNHVFSDYGGPWLTGLDDSYDLSAIFDIYRGSMLPGIAQTAAAGEEESGTREEKASHSVRADLLANINRAEAFHKAVEQTAHDKTYVLCSTGLRTDSGIEFLDFAALKYGSISDPDARPKVRSELSGVGDADLTDAWNQVTYHRSADGDGTVPGNSARCPALEPAALEPACAARGLEHAAAYGNANFQGLALSYIHRLLTP